VIRRAGTRIAGRGFQPGREKLRTEYPLEADYMLTIQGDQVWTGGTEQVTCIKTLNNVLKCRIIDCYLCGDFHAGMVDELLVSGAHRKKETFCERD
jgi:hypothetical protein